MTERRPGGADAHGADPRHPVVVEQTYGPVWWTGLAAGTTVMAFAVWGIVHDADGTNPPALAKWVIGSALVHDVLVAPFVTVAGIVLGRFLPASLRGPVRGAAAMSALVTIFAIPLVRSFGKHADNPSTLPLDYGRNLAIVLALIWSTAASVVLWRRWQGER